MLSLCCLLFAIASVSTGKETQIVGGSQARNCEFPSIVHLQIFNQPTDDRISVCGGTLIDPTHVLTAAHCLEGHVRRVKVNIGSNNKWAPGPQSTTASQIVKHGGYVHTKLLIKNDIAILTLNRAVHEDGCVQFATMAEPQETFDGKRCIAAGWGDFQFEGNSPNELYKVALRAIPHDVCKDKSRMQIADGVLCAGDFVEGGPSTCQGDSGGPLYCRGSKGKMVLAGVTSFGHNCDTKVSAFSAVGYFRNWIDSHL